LAIKRTGYKIFTGLSQGIVRVLKDSEAQHQEGELVPNTASSESVSEGEGDGSATTSDDRGGATDANEEITPRIKSTPAEQGTPSK
jgi:hypothetical protein